MKKKKIKIIVASLILLALAIPTSVYGYSYHSYDVNLKNAETLLADEKYDESAKAFLNLKASKFSNRDASLIDTKVKLISELKQSKEVFNSAEKLLDENKYIEAINSLKNVKQIDKSRYDKAQEKIKEVTNLYITDNIAKAKAEADNKHYESAIAFLDTVLKFDQKNEVANNLKVTYNKELQSIKEVEASKQAIDQASQIQQGSTKESNGTKSSSVNSTASNKSSSSSNANNTATSKPTNNTTTATDKSGYTVTYNDSWFRVHLNSGVATPEGFGIQVIQAGSQPGGIYYNFLGNNVKYQITFHLPKGDFKVSDVSSNDFHLIPSDIAGLTKNQILSGDITAVYKGKTYTGSFSRVIN
ncbi:tetratricopeptide repeat protein [Clostridium fungisolvens]|uniref:Uncharacterized protein n=1 Tax=Clostridium fungisolvens TaxID=1604897 RepID=A0A6V8SEX3_9CLOT|nr:hypothetical protein [Clostridium fungisolvens]GFP75610.1 hypothetical protein bsdtw1_01697 [Clostridium fungisolvens]